MLITTASACSKPDLCKQESFFCQSRDSWKDNAKELSDREVYHLNKLLINYYSPSDESLLNEVGSRGKTAIDLLINDINSSRMFKNYSYIITYVDAVRRNGNYDICNYNDERRRLEEAIEKSAGVRTSLVNQFCQKGVNPK
ncbi:hypothetical protein MOK15_09795 [Sphingobium sp. BYY-5]|uniref:hypothetical protein n=1 Tax=Sphingobium sp. BYY-5 TaxID=2926400 RepID=UPI001FA6DFB9|nr:hypothetical protein [Sphingobium sp. BYY-5]MCI4590386.1 hypothetical protein [Sphingobium sp. BYY-5]